ncbi:sulfite exporter TauE/SafE family protein [Endobacterium cereale]|nr:sulfite exporter TauE/SafE family protein [Endobacterium cereale]MEB2847605.1 sulfite exporter TauE/SafE family protein [Endobacterium cereale]
MSLIIFIGMAVTVFLTSLLSGIFGMAGGLILLWVLLFLYPVGTAIAIQGVIQMVSNGSRAWFSRAYIDWKILAVLCSGVAVSALILFITSYTPNLMVVLIGVGLMPILVWLPVNKLKLDASRPSHAFLAGVLSGGMTISVGVAGPTVDIFFIRTEMDRRKVIATKASIQTLSHMAKIAFYWDAASQLPTVDAVAVLIAAPIAILGARAGNGILQRITDANFRSWTRWVVTAVGAVYLTQGLLKLI